MAPKNLAPETIHTTLLAPKQMWATEKQNNSYFPLNPGCLNRDPHFMVYEKNPHKTGGSFWSLIPHTRGGFNPFEKY